MREVNALTDLQNDSALGQGTCNSENPRILRDNWRSQRAVEMIVDSGWTPTWTMYGTYKTLNTVLVMMVQQSRHRECPSFWSSPNDFAIMHTLWQTSTTVAYVLCARITNEHASNFTRQYAASSSTKGILTWRIFCQRTLIVQGNKGLRESDRPTWNSFPLVKQTPKHNCKTILHTHCTRNCWPWSSGDEKPSTRTSVAVT